MTETPKMKTLDCAILLADRFSPVPREQLHPGQIAKVREGEFGCDDYHLLFETIWGENPDAMSLLRNAIRLREATNSPRLKNHEVATIVEGIVFQPNSEPDTLYQISLTGFWRAKAPPIQY